MSATMHIGPRFSHSSTMSQSISSERKKSVRKENMFIMRHGSRLHAYGRDKVPYPLSYDRPVLEMWSLDRHLVQYARGNVSFIDFKGNTPKRCLDLGTGVGDWVIEAAKQWPECTFAGYDLVNVQIPLRYLDSSVADRIEWFYGNMLRQKLPFENDEFDHVHFTGMAFTAPEHKWHSIFEEIRRVLRPGGTIEMLDEDAVFPVLPRWFTTPLHAQTKRPSALFPDGSQRSLPSTTSEDLPHDYALLETLFLSVFESRFINPTPSAILPAYFSDVFRHVLSPPVFNTPMPPLAPLTPLPGELMSSPSIHSLELSETSTLYSSSGAEFSHLASVPRSTTLDANGADDPPSSTADSASHVSLDAQTIAPEVTRSMSSDSGSSRSTNRSSQRRSVTICTPSDSSTTIGDSGHLELIPMDLFTELPENFLYMQLYRAMWLVLAAKEAMWDELLVKVNQADGCLRPYGWDEEDYLEDISRQKFEALLERYKGDMHVRVSFWHTLTKYGWPYPPREPLSKAELIEEERLRQAILEARRSAADDDSQRPCRSIRLLVGMKGE